MNGNKKKLFDDEEVGAIHFVGIGGAGMSALATVMLEMGYPISGSDLQLTSTTDRLSRQGARIYQGHSPSRIGKARLIIYSSAIGRGNPELEAARHSGRTIWHRSDLLKELLDLKKSVVVAGSHGKTGTAAMLTWILREAGLAPAFIVGGELIDLQTNAGWGSGDLLVAEADESDGSFLKLSPFWEVITGIDLDHVDYYPTWQSLREAFQTFIHRLGEEGCLIIPAGDRNLEKLVSAKTPYLTYGEGEGASVGVRDVRFRKDGSRCTVYQGSEVLGEMELRLLGPLNMINALASVTMGMVLGVPFPEMARALKKYRGVRRRLEVKLQTEELLVVEDYAHHPIEIAAALKAIRTTSPRRLWCLFQPHRYSRLAHFSRALARALSGADRLILTDLYPAFEEPREGVNSRLIMRELKARKSPSVQLLSKKEILPFLIPQLEPGDAVVVMGAGDIGELADELVEKCRLEAGK